MPFKEISIYMDSTLYTTCTEATPYQRGVPSCLEISDSYWAIVTHISQTTAQNPKC